MELILQLWCLLVFFIFIFIFVCVLTFRMLPKHSCLVDSFRARAFCGTYSKDGSVFLCACQGKQHLSWPSGEPCKCDPSPLLLYLLQIVSYTCITPWVPASRDIAPSVLVMSDGAYWTLTSGRMVCDFGPSGPLNLVPMPIFLLLLPTERGN